MKVFSNTYIFFNYRFQLPQETTIARVLIYSSIATMTSKSHLHLSASIFISLL
jgi:hypothetical protein